MDLGPERQMETQMLKSNVESIESKPRVLVQLPSGISDGEIKIDFLKWRTSLRASGGRKEPR